MPNVVITGANQGIGLEFARQLRARGDSVFGSCRANPGPLAEIGATVVKDIETTDAASIEKLVAAAPADTNMLILNAAVLPLDGCDTIGELDASKMVRLDLLKMLSPLGIAFDTIMFPYRSSSAWKSTRWRHSWLPRRLSRRASCPRAPWSCCHRWGRQP